MRGELAQLAIHMRQQLWATPAAAAVGLSLLQNERDLVHGPAVYCGAPIRPSIHDIFCEAIEIAPPQDRAQYLSRACGDDAEVRARVEQLLDAHAREGGILEV